MNKFYELLKENTLLYFKKLAEDKRLAIVKEISGGDFDENGEETPVEYIENTDGESLWEDLHNTVLSYALYDILMGVLKDAWCQTYEDCDYDFIDELMEDVATRMLDHDEPESYFSYVMDNGCASGVVPMFIYNSDCEDFYIKHIDDLEDYKQTMEDNLGEPISSKKGLPHHTFICWLCYEEFVYNLNGILFD